MFFMFYFSWQFLKSLFFCRPAFYSFCYYFIYIYAIIIYRYNNKICPFLFVCTNYKSDGISPNQFGCLNMALFSSWICNYFLHWNLNVSMLDTTVEICWELLYLCPLCPWLSHTCGSPSGYQDCSSPGCFTS